MVSKLKDMRGQIIGVQIFQGFDGSGMQSLAAVVDLHLVGRFAQQVAPEQVFAGGNFCPNGRFFQCLDPVARRLVVTCHTHQDRFVEFSPEDRCF